MNGGQGVEDPGGGEVAVLIDTSEEVREVLARYKRANARLAARVAQGDSVLEAFDSIDGAMQRERELSETLEQFESARHQVRLALFALATA